MKLRRIEIQNCNWCPDLAIDVRGHLVLVGPNEAGKSTVLRMLDALLAWSHGRLVSEFGLTVFRDVDRFMSVTVKLGDLNGDDRAAFADEIAVVDGQEPSLSLELLITRSSEDPDGVDIQRRFQKEGVAPVRLIQRHLAGIRWTLLSASRSADRELGRGKSGTVASLLASIDLGEEEAGLADAVRKLNEFLATSGVLEESRRQIATAFSEVFPRVIKVDDLQMQLSAGHNPLDDVDVRLASSSGQHISLLDQSDGLRSLSIISLQLLVRSEATITAVDEPEVHLHPRSQARLGRLLASKQGQRVVASHAPALVRNFPPSDVVAFTSVGVRQLSAGQIESDKKFFSQWWVEATLEALTSNSVLLVEGASDAIVVRRAAELSSIDLDHKGVCVVVLGGANNFSNAYRLLGPKGFGVPIFSLVDELEATIPAKALGVAEIDLEASNVFTCQTDLEDVYVKALGAASVADSLLRSGLFKDNRLRQSHGVTSLSSATEDQLLDLCRNEKVQAAIAISETLTLSDLPNLGPVARLARALS